MSPFLVASFYRFAPFDDLESMQAAVRECCENNEVRGIVLLATEGINATISGTHEGVMAVMIYQRANRFVLTFIPNTCVRVQGPVPKFPSRD